MDLNLRVIMVSVHDLERMESFYSELFGKQPERVDEGRLLEYEFDGVLFGLYNPAADGDGGGIEYGTSVVPAFKSQSFQEHREWVEGRADAEIVFERCVADHQWFVFEDCEGNRIEVYEHPVESQ